MITGLTQELKLKVLIAEDDFVSRRLLENTLKKWGYQVQVTRDGRTALQALLAPEAPQLALLDWMMPGLDGVEICKVLRQTPTAVPPYLILVTARSGKENVVMGLDAGADDYITKPYDRQELRARLQSGRRILALQNKLAERVRQLEDTLTQVKQLQGLLPICCYCKKIRDDRNYWQQVEAYISARCDARFSHGICPDCFHKEVVPQLVTAGADPRDVEDLLQSAS